MEALLEFRSLLEEETSILDLGTGTGILAMFAAQLGFKDILALDNDRVAVEVARQNVASNGLDRVIEVSDEPIQSVGRGFSLILANLTGTLHEELAKEMLDHLETRGWLVLGEYLSTRARVGCGLMLAGGIVSQLRAQRALPPV